MKSSSFFFLFIAAMVATVFLVDCNGTSSGSVVDNGVLLFEMEGNRWISAPPGHPEMRFEEEAIYDGKSTLKIEGFAADGSYLTLTIYKESGITPGVYKIINKGMLGFYKPDFSKDAAYTTAGMPDNQGFIVVSEITDSMIKGGFNFPIRNAADPNEVKLISGGSFEIRFSQN